MNIFITGIAGFLGSNLAEQLIADGHKVFGNDTLICGNEGNVPRSLVKYDHWFPIDCNQRNNLECLFKARQIDVVVHCAATAHEGLSSFSPSFITKNIYEASVSVFSAAIAAGVKRIVYMSSMSRYGDQEPPFSESMPPKPVDPYAVAKVAAEDTLKILAKTHGIAYSILVPHNIIGVKQRYVDPFRNVAAIMINRCKQGKAPIIYGDGSQIRCFSPVADCIPSIINAIHGAADGFVVNIGPDRGEMSIKDLAGIVMKLTGYNGDPIYMPGRPNEVHAAFTTSDKARALLGYKEKQTVLDCLYDMCQWIQPAPFKYDFPIEITEGCPKTWTEKLM